MARVVRGPAAAGGRGRGRAVHVMPTLAGVGRLRDLVRHRALRKRALPLRLGVLAALRWCACNCAAPSRCCWRQHNACSAHTVTRTIRTARRAASHRALPPRAASASVAPSLTDGGADGVGFRPSAFPARVASVPELVVAATSTGRAPSFALRCRSKRRWEAPRSARPHTDRWASGKALGRHWHWAVTGPSVALGRQWHWAVSGPSVALGRQWHWAVSGTGMAVVLVKGKAAIRPAMHRTLRHWYSA